MIKFFLFMASGDKKKRFKKENYICLLEEIW